MLAKSVTESPEKIPNRFAWRSHPMKYALAMLLVMMSPGAMAADADDLISGPATMVTTGNPLPICGTGDFEGPCRFMATADEYIRLRNICLSVPQCAAKLAAEK